ncbi:lytic transglycosylase domain-containing protein [Tsuneonella sp. CC-YZS046]|uniref:lytic transglycosylase domain-containing protein n=1 Tax=Tsuneonella sp. CC-YZS046 TaxID=3042152 RepID=UPI002D79E228|nr:lytic transglycosylase domain-containing protein [Tsuneonella sp. CC-YZS046]WRO66815.1 lytic transglycosylase domain-containing protein [Tsuneonella sp. CC-YZS046]
MSEVKAVGAPDVRMAIARAAQATGVDFDYLLAQARLESRLDPEARASMSSAAGLYQFIGSTWLETLDRHGATHGFGWANAAIGNNGRGATISDPALRSQVMSLRFDPDAASLMAAELAKDNQAALRGTLGREPDYAELYLAHFLGRDGASRFLGELQNNPGQSAAALFPKPAGANRPVFFERDGSPRSLQQVMDFLRQRLDKAMGQEGDLPFSAMAMSSVSAVTEGAQAQPVFTGGPLAREFQAAVVSHPAGSRVSMAETLRQTFAGHGDGQSSALPGSVRAAYGKLKAYGL